MMLLLIAIILFIAVLILLMVNFAPAKQASSTPSFCPQGNCGGGGSGCPRCGMPSPQCGCRYN